MKSPEAKFKAVFLKRLREIPKTEWFPIEQSVLRGDADILGCVRGRFIALECKVKFCYTLKPHEKLQMRKLRNVIEAGGVGYIATPANMNLLLRMFGGRPMEKKKQPVVQKPVTVVKKSEDKKGKDKSKEKDKK